MTRQYAEQSQPILNLFQEMSYCAVFKITSVERNQTRQTKHIQTKPNSYLDGFVYTVYATSWDENIRERLYHQPRGLQLPNYCHW